MPGAVAGAARARGGAIYQPITIHKSLDKASPKLQQALATGRRIARVVIELTRPGKGSAAVYYRMELENAQVTSYRVSVNDRGQATEEVAITFAQIAVVYTQIDKTGRASGNVQFKYDVAARK